MAIDIIARALGAKANKRIDGLSTTGAPYIQNGNWYIWDYDLSIYKDSGVRAEGIDGNGISTIEKTNTNGLEDTYTISFTNGTSTTFTVTNGSSAMINGQNAINIIAGDNIELNQDGEILTISSTGGLEEIPQATDSILGGVKAKARTGENAEVAIDTITGKLYVESFKGEIKSYSTVIVQSDINDDSVNISHNLNSENIVVNIYDNEKNMIIPDSIVIIDENIINISLSSFVPLVGSYRLVILCEDIDISAGTVGYNRKITQSDLVNGTILLEHNLNNEAVIVNVYNNEKRNIIPDGVQIIDNNSFVLNLTNYEPLIGEYNVVVLSDSTGSADFNGAVLYNKEQSLTDSQKSQAKNNLGIPADLQVVANLIPTATSDLTNDSGFLINTVTDLVNYYDKAEVDVIIAAISQLLTYEVVEELPTTDIETNVIYLKLVEGSTSNYSMNMFINELWYELGETAIDLSQYVTLVDYNNKIIALEEDLDLKVDNTITKISLDSDLTNNTEYIVNLSADTIISSATGWGSISVTALGNLTLTIPTEHKWAEGIDGYIENGTQVMVLYDNGRWSRIDWR